jgi:hypothetical protein
MPARQTTTYDNLSGERKFMLSKGNDLVSLVQKLFSGAANALFRGRACLHTNITWPRTANGASHVVCQKCLAEIQYNGPLLLSTEERSHYQKKVKRAKAVLAAELKLKAEKSATPVMQIRGRRANNA